MVRAGKLLREVGCSTLLFFSAWLFASSEYVLDSDHQLYPASYSFIHDLSSELFEKSGVSVYIIAHESLEGQSLESYKSSLKLKEPFVYLIFLRKEKKIDIDGSKSVMEKINAQDIYWDYIVPLIPKKDSELTASNISAFLINGYIAVVEEIAQALNVSLENKYIPENKGIQTASKAILYMMTLVLLVLFILFLLRKKNA